MATRKKTLLGRSTKKSSKNQQSGKISGGGVTAKSSSRSTISGPTNRRSSQTSSNDALVRKLDLAQKVAAGMPYNANKPAEHGQLARQPKAGQTVKPDDPEATGSTLTETTPSPKAGGGKPQLGFNPGTLPLDRVRVDSSDQGLTTNLGVPVADNQNSLKAGLRGQIGR